MKKLATTSFAALAMAPVLALCPALARADELSPHAPLGEVPHYEMRAPAMLASGVAVSTLGVGMIGTGAWFFTQDAGSGGGCIGCIHLNLVRPAGAILMAVGAAHVVVGVPLIAVGASRKPVKERATATRLDLGLTPEGVALSGMF